MKRRKRRIGIALLLLLLLICPPFWITYRKYRQARLDHALIEAIKARDDRKALEALAEGASGEARDAGDPPTFQEALLRLWKHLRHPGEEKSDTSQYPPALLLLYWETMDRRLGFGDTSLEFGPNLAVVRALLDHGAAVNDRYSGDWMGYPNGWIGWTPLHVAVEFSNSETARLLLERGADPNLMDQRGVTPLMNTNYANHVDVLLKHGADIEAVDKDRHTALWHAAGGNSCDVIRVLLKHRANIDATDGNKQTALMEAANNDFDEIVVLLLQHGAKTGMRDSEGKTALDYIKNNLRDDPND